MRGAELCLVVEAMYSGSYTYKTFGNNAIADRVERMAYNALPAALTSSLCPSVRHYAYTVLKGAQTCGHASSYSS
jgi:hypothetical protein